jgi:ATP-dependent RNA helicase SUPV3L1/SUV3
VHLKTWNFANPSEARNAGYRRIGDEYVRIDLAERVIKKAHEARGQNNVFGMDMAFATSLGISEAGLKALMRDAGFRPAEAVADLTPVVEESTPVEAKSAPETEAAVEAIVADAVAPEQTAPKETAPVVLTHWRWVGLPKPRPTEQRRPHASAERKPHASAKPKAKPDRAPPAPKPSAPPSALALQLAALKGLKL